MGRWRGHGSLSAGVIRIGMLHSCSRWRAVFWSNTELCPQFASYCLWLMNNSESIHHRITEWLSWKELWEATWSKLLVYVQAAFEYIQCLSWCSDGTSCISHSVHCLWSYQWAPLKRVCLLFSLSSGIYISKNLLVFTYQ